MNDSSSWWDRKLGRAPAPAQVGPNSYAPTSYAPTHQAPAMPAAPTGPPTVWVEDPNHPDGKRFNWRGWQGGQANREETNRCPQCGSTNFFSLRSQAKVTPNGMAAPAPQCFECNYNGGLFNVFGGG